MAGAGLFGELQRRRGKRTVSERVLESEKIYVLGPRYEKGKSCSPRGELILIDPTEAHKAVTCGWACYCWRSFMGLLLEAETMPVPGPVEATRDREWLA
jgi:hypothetical protein